MPNDSSIARAVAAAPHDLGPARFLRVVCGGFGVLFLLMGVLGFVPGVTTHYDGLRLAGSAGRAELAGVFEVSVLHNLIHLAYGVVGLVLAPRPRPAALYLVLGGCVYAGVWLYGLTVVTGREADVVALNTADNWLHLVLFVAMVVLGALGLRLLQRRRWGPSLA